MYDMHTISTTPSPVAFVCIMRRKYSNSDRAFGEPPLYCCTNSYKRMLEAHLVQAVAKITKSYEVGIEGTTALVETCVTDRCCASTE